MLRDHVVSVERIPAGMIRVGNLVERVHNSIDPPGGGPLPLFDVADAQQLYALTLGRVAPALDGVQSLVVAPTGPLLSLPWNIMLTGPANQAQLAGAPWLIRQYVVSQLPAASSFTSLRLTADNSRATRPWFGAGDPAPIPYANVAATFPESACPNSANLLSSLPRLQYARKELDAGRGWVHAAPSDELTGAQFNSQALFAAPLMQYRVIDFSMHGLSAAEVPCLREPALVASDGLLPASALMRLRLDANVVVLSACNTGGPDGGAAGAEALSGLARVFFFDGGRALLVSFWHVSDQVGAYLAADTLKYV